uniref:Uncharacterized protein n=1 Tax=Parascaris equorum TaxID=6256 RepID=A0A914RQA5_PAREQ
MTPDFTAGIRKTVFFADGKEAYRRITLPGGGTVEHLKLTVERSMRMGRVAQVILLPDRIPIETQEQIRCLYLTSGVNCDYIFH